jgi:hypothetical protein
LTTVHVTPLMDVTFRPVSALTLQTELGTGLRDQCDHVEALNIQHNVRQWFPKCGQPFPPGGCMSRWFKRLQDILVK